MGNEQISNASILVADTDRDEIGRSETGSHIARSEVGGEEMFLGMDFLRSHRILISHSQKKVYFTYSGGPLFGANPVPETRDDPKPEANAVPLPETRQSD